MANIEVITQINDLLDANDVTIAKAALGVLGAAVKGDIVNADISATAAINVSKLSSSSASAGLVLTSTGGNSAPTFQSVSGTGDVVGPANATDNAIARFDTGTGKLLQNSLVTVSDAGAITTAQGTASVIPFFYATYASFPVAGAANHGAIAHADDTGAMYYSHNSAWVKMLDTNTTAITATLTGNASTSTSLASGTAGAIPYQSAAGTTGFSAAGTAGQVLLSGGANAPTWGAAGSTPADGSITTAKLASNAVTPAKMATGAALGNIKPELVAFIGDSITDQGEYVLGTGTESQTGTYGYHNWVCSSLFGRVQPLARSKGFSVRHFATSGFTINAIRGVAESNFTARPLNEIIAANSLLAILAERIKGKNVAIVDFAITNDITSGGYTDAEIASKRSVLWQELITCGVDPLKMVSVAAIPRNSDVGNATINARIIAVNAINQASATALGITWVTTPSAMLTSGYANPNYFYDGNIHPNRIGAQVLGGAVATALNPIVSTQRFAMPLSTDARWLTPNPYMTGSVSVAGTNRTGVAATSWGLPFNPDATVVFSKQADSEGEFQRIVNTISGGNRDQGFVLKCDLPQIAAGTRFRIVARVKGTGFNNFIIQITGHGAALNWAGSLTNQNPLDLNSFNETMIGPVQTMPTGLQNGWQLWVAAGGNGTLDIRQVGLLLEDDFEVLSQPVTGQRIVNINNNVGTVPAFPATVFVGTNFASSYTFALPTITKSIIGNEYTFVRTDTSTAQPYTYTMRGAVTTKTLGSTTSTSATITYPTASPVAAALPPIGSGITGTGIPTNTRVVSASATSTVTTVVISNAATLSNAGIITFTFTEPIKGTTDPTFPFVEFGDKITLIAYADLSDSTSIYNTTAWIRTK